MDCRLYETKLATHNIFKDVKESLKDNSNAKLRNLFEFKDDVLYVWNSIETCLFSVNLKRLDEHNEEASYQKLHLLSPPAFNVEHIISSECGSRLCIWGSRGVIVTELPSRWSRGGLFDSGSQTVLCKSFSLDERFLYLQGEIHRVHWHPKSLSHLLVLVSDNTMRLYNIGLKTGPKLVKAFTIGPKPAGALGQTVLDSFGDTAVDFTPTPDSDHLLILSGNGDVYMMQCELDNNSPRKAKLMGPLAMYPPADDNYGSESCAITALGGIDTPTLVVIASASAVLYHCLLLPNATEVGDDSHALYVVESVELNVMGEDDSALQYVCPVHLYPVNRNTYACAHAGGVHSVTLPVLERLCDYAAADEGDMESILQVICSKPSTARYLLHTSGQSSPIVGLAVTPAPLRTLLLLCSSGDFITRMLEPCNLEEQFYKEMQLKNPALEQGDINEILKEMQQLSFTSIIQEVLERQTSQPILKLDKKEELSNKVCLEILAEVTLKLRSEYIMRQQRALEVMRRKTESLKTLGGQHREWLCDLQREVEDVQLQTTVLKEKRDLIEKYQEDMKYRCSAVVRHLRAGCGRSGEERRVLAELLQHQRNIATLAEQINTLKLHKLHKQNEMKKWQEEYKKKDTVLGKSHSDTIWAILQQQTAQISSLIEETKLLKDQLGVV